jgi:hypothetical protein
MTDHKKYALGQVENFLYDAMSAEATPQEIYDTIRGAVQDNLNVYTKSADQARELLNLLNGHRPINFDIGHDHIFDHKKGSDIYHDQMIDAGYVKSADGLWVHPVLNSSTKKDKVKKWILPVDDDYNITFPEDLLEQTGWKEGDTLQWIDQGDGSFKIIKKGN